MTVMIARLLVALIAAAIAIDDAMAQIRILSVTDGATFTSGLPYYGSLASVFCTGLTGIDGVQSVKKYPLPFEIAGISVHVDGFPAPLLAVTDFGSYQQINIQVSGVQGLIEVSQGGQHGEMQAQAPVTWGVFFTDASGYAFAQHADYSLVTHDHPAQPGEVIIAYGTNLASLPDIMHAPPIGSPALADPLPSLPMYVSFPGLRLVRSVRINGNDVSVFFLGLAPGSVGVFQINFRVPVETPEGDVMLNTASCGGSCFIGALCGAPGFLSQCRVSRAAKIPVRAPSPSR